MQNQRTKLDKQVYYLQKDFLAIYVLVAFTLGITVLSLLVLLPGQIAEKNYLFIPLVLITLALSAVALRWIHNRYNYFGNKIGFRIYEDFDIVMNHLKTTLKELGYSFTHERIFNKWRYFTGWCDHLEVNGNGIAAVFEIITNKFGTQEFEILLNYQNDIQQINLIYSRLIENLKVSNNN